MQPQMGLEVILLGLLCIFPRELFSLFHLFIFCFFSSVTMGKYLLISCRFFLSPLQLFCSGGFFLKFLSRNQKTAKKRRLTCLMDEFFCCLLLSYLSAQLSWQRNTVIFL